MKKNLVLGLLPVFFLIGANPVMGLERCGTPSPSPEVAEEVSNTIQAFLAGGEMVEAAQPVVIPVAFHVVRHDDGSADVTDQQIQDQLDVLNTSYASSGYQFTLHGIDRTDNTAWSTHSPGSSKEKQMKSALAISPECVLNFYIADLGGGLLGYAIFPFSYDEDSYMHGVVVLYSSLPGGDTYPYDEGDTGTHEVGHYLGLYHTFEGGCSSPGDEVDDTPYEREPAFGCPIGRDTCQSKPGDDPIYNFMDYSDDACMNEFTLDQAERMNAMVQLYKPTLWEGCSSQAPDVAGCIEMQGKPLVNKKVFLTQKKEPKQKTQTDQDGCYSFDDVAAGKTFVIKIKGPKVP
jgi:hypothetical protein